MRDDAGVTGAFRRGRHVILVRNQDPTLNRGLPTFQDERGDGLEASLDFVTDTKSAMFLQKNRGDICQIEDKKFQTLSSAVEYVKDEYHNSALIEMLTDYAIPAADKVRRRGRNRCHQPRTGEYGLSVHKRGYLEFGRRGTGKPDYP